MYEREYRGTVSWRFFVRTLRKGVNGIRTHTSGFSDQRANRYTITPRFNQFTTKSL